MNQRNRKGNKKYEIEIFVDKIEGTGESTCFRFIAG